MPMTQMMKKRKLTKMKSKMINLKMMKMTLKFHCNSRESAIAASQIKRNQRRKSRKSKRLNREEMRLQSEDR